MKYKWNKAEQHPDRNDMLLVSGTMHAPPALAVDQLRAALQNLYLYYHEFEPHSFEVRMPSRREKKRNGTRHHLRVTLRRRETPEDEQ